MKLQYNAPVTLTYTLATALVLAMTAQLPTLKAFFVISPFFSFDNPADYFRLFSHVIGHANLNHFVSNFTFILLLGPILEEKHSSSALLVMIGFTALITSILTILFSSTGLLGASGIVFMLIILSSITHKEKGKIPLTFILVTVFFLGKEVMNMLAEDNISQTAHIIGGICGGIFGFFYNRGKDTEQLEGNHYPDI